MEEEQLQSLIDYTKPPLTFGANSGLANEPAAKTSIPFFLCPSDQGYVPNNIFGANNYVANTGTGTVLFGHLGNGGDGVFYDGSKTSFRKITDGSSHTAAFSESLLGDNQASTMALPTSNRMHVLELSGGSDTTDMACGAGIGVWSGVRGAKWINGHYGDTLYNHYYLPNAETWDCGNGSHNKALVSARSAHVGGVYVLFCDGHLSFVEETIDLTIWRAMATREGAEIFDDPTSD
jgi:prepilin-type processing-associated H-X9-DG protein